MLSWSPTGSCYPYIIISYCSQPLFSNWDLQVTRKSGTQNSIFDFRMWEILATILGDVDLVLGWKLLSLVKTANRISFTHENGMSRRQDK